MWSSGIVPLDEDNHTISIFTTHDEDFVYLLEIHDEEDEDRRMFTLVLHRTDKALKEPFASILYFYWHGDAILNAISAWCETHPAREMTIPTLNEIRDRVLMEELL